MYYRFEVKKRGRFYQVVVFSTPDQKRGRWLATFSTQEAANRYKDYLQR